MAGLFYCISLDLSIKKKKVKFKNQGLIQLKLIQEENLEYIYDVLTVVKAAPPNLSLANSHGDLLLKHMQTCLI